MTAEFQFNHLPQTARALLDFAQNRKIFLFLGEMGAGKTTLIKAICAELGTSASVSSPTFALVNEYEYPAGLVYHFDCYRLKNPNEALDMGIEEYLDSGEYCFIEWPEKIAGLWPAQYVQVSLNTIDAETREISLELIG